jgi:hypothetical protein
MLKRELKEFRRLKGYFPQIYLVHLCPTLEKEIWKEVKEISKELNTQIHIAKENQSVVI